MRDADWDDDYDEVEVRRASAPVCWRCERYRARACGVCTSCAEDMGIDPDVRSRRTA